MFSPLEFSDFKTLRRLEGTSLPAGRQCSQSGESSRECLDFTHSNYQFFKKCQHDTIMQGTPEPLTNHQPPLTSPRNTKCTITAYREHHPYRSIICWLMTRYSSAVERFS